MLGLYEPSTTTILSSMFDPMLTGVPVFLKLGAREDDREEELGAEDEERDEEPLLWLVPAVPERVKGGRSRMEGGEDRPDACR